MYLGAPRALQYCDAQDILALSWRAGSVHLSFFGLSVGLGAAIGVARLIMVAFLVKKKPAGEFSYFNTWSIFGSLAVLLSLPALFWTSCQQYFYVCWVLGILYLGLEFFVIYELVVSALKSYSALIDLGKMLFTWALVFLTIVAAITALSTVGTHQSRLEAAAAVIERSLRLIECGILMLFFFFEKRLQLPWRNWSVSLALGLGLTSAVDLISSYVRIRLPHQTNQIDCLYSLVFLGVMSFWTYSLLYKPQRREISIMAAPSHLIFQRWNESLGSSGFGDFTATDSFFPNVERTVERVMARKMTQ
jgi:hypothetical protein